LFGTSQDSYEDNREIPPRFDVDRKFGDRKPHLVDRFARSEIGHIVASIGRIVATEG
jgi:hypothetical protein